MDRGWTNDNSARTRRRDLERISETSKQFLVYMDTHLKKFNVP